MYETVLKYQMRMGWTDRTTVSVLSDFIETLLSPSHEAHERVEELVNYMERRAEEEEEFASDFDDEFLEEMDDV